MNITTDQVLDALSKDDLQYVRAKLDMLIPEARASLEATVGLPTNITTKQGSTIDLLTDRYIVEYCRAALDGVDNERILLTLQIQIQGVLKTTAQNDDETT